MFQQRNNIKFYSEDNDAPEKKMDFKSIMTTLNFIKESDSDLFYSCIFYIVWGGSKFNFANVKTIQGKHNILVWIADELGKVPSKNVQKQFDIVFKNHLREEVPQCNVFSLPLFTPLDNLPKMDKIITEREYDVFFSGCLNKNRILLLWGLQGIPGGIAKFLYKLSCVKGVGRLVSQIYCGKNYDYSYKIKNSIIKFTDGFYHGYSPTTYAKLTAKAKIILNPRGFHSTECFRMYEGMAAGCIVFSETLPPLNIYKNIPVIQVGNWSSLYRMVRTILSDSTKMREMSEKTSQFYQEHLSNSGIALYMRKIIKNNI